MASTSTVPCRNSAGPSMTTAPSTVLPCVVAADQHERGERGDQGDEGQGHLDRSGGSARGANASTSTPTRAAPKTISIGRMAP